MSERISQQSADSQEIILSIQEVIELAPTNFDYLARCSKAWSDATYLDEISGRFKEKLTDQAKRDFNERALGYGKKVCNSQHHALSFLSESCAQLNGRDACLAGIVLGQLDREKLGFDMMAFQ